MGNRNIPVAIAMGYGLDDRGSIPGRSKILLFSVATRPALGPTQSPVQWEPGDYLPIGKAAVLEADHSSLSSSKVKSVAGTASPLLQERSVRMSTGLIWLKLRVQWSCLVNIVITSRLRSSGM
jgi:hypothetical protein